jgi:hypothetical protein
VIAQFDGAQGAYTGPAQDPDAPLDQTMHLGGRRRIVVDHHTVDEGHFVDLGGIDRVQIAFAGRRPHVGAGQHAEHLLPAEGGSDEDRRLAPVHGCAPCAARYSRNEEPRKLNAKTCRGSAAVIGPLRCTVYPWCTRQEPTGTAGAVKLNPSASRS